MRLHLHRRHLIPLLMAGTLAVISFARATCAEEGSSEAKKPNILLIVSDDQGYHDLGCFGCEEIETPNLDRIAEEGVRLTSFYVTWPACTPSRGSLLTGRYPQRNGTYDMFRNDKVDHGYVYPPAEYAVSWEMIGGMDPREVLLPKVLKRSGYVSGIFGKWDLGQLDRFLPLARGFDDFYGFTNTGIDYFTHERYGVPSMRRDNEPTTEDKGIYCTTLFDREAGRFLEENRRVPFFLYVPYNAPHNASNLDREIRMAPQAPPEYIEHYRKKLPELNKDTRQAKKRRRYLASVTCMDDSIGRLLDQLDRYDLAENTIVVFFSDNGGGTGSDNSPLRSGKGRMFEGGVRVPCLVRWPAELPAETVCDEFLTSMEIFPTLLAATGTEPPEGVVLDGFDMLPVLKGETASPRKQMFWERRGDRAARVGDWKWVDSKAGSGLFYLPDDLAEENDLSEKRPDMLAKLKNDFQTWKAEMDAAEPRRPFKNY